MGLIYRRRLRLNDDGTWANLSRSGVSLSRQLGRLTLNSRGQGRVRLARGWSWRFRL